MVVNIHGFYRSEEQNIISLDVLEDTIKSVINKGEALAACTTDEMLSTFYELYQQWAMPSHPMYHKYRQAGLAFLLTFLHPDSLTQFIRRGLRHEKALDDIVELQGFHGLAVPKGVVGHWLAGNVPLLSIISVVQALLTKNISIVKLSSKQVDWVTPFLTSLSECGETGRKMAESVLVLTYPGNEQEINRMVASYCDVRIAWGGTEAVQAVSNLPGKPGSVTLMFGPKLSCSIIELDLMEKDDWIRLARDIVLFRQLACTSPHAVFIKGDFNAVLQGADALSGAFQKITKQAYMDIHDAGETSKVLHYRTEAWMRKEKLRCSEGTEWTLHLHEHLEEFVGRGLNIVHMFGYEDIKNIIPCLPKTLQTVTHKLQPQVLRELVFASKHTGTARIVPIGESHNYNIPWDGMLVLDQLVRWIRVEGS